jgi:hypothetical protein
MKLTDEEKNIWQCAYATAFAIECQNHRIAPMKNGSWVSIHSVAAQAPIEIADAAVRALREWRSVGSEPIGQEVSEKHVATGDAEL